MSKLSLSLKARQILVFFSIIVLVLPLVFVSIEQAFKQSQVKALEQQLEANLYAIIGEIDLDAKDPTLGSGFLPPSLNQSDSGTLALIEHNNQVIWRSDSGLHQRPTMVGESIVPGQAQFNFVSHYWRYSYAMFYDNDYGTHNLVIHVMQHESVLEAQLGQFNQIITGWFFTIATVLVLALAFGLWSTLLPLRRLDEQIRQVEKGALSQISGNFPKELTRVKEDLNLLIKAQQRQKDQYRSYLSDLTHALKTPVAVMRSSEICQNAMVTEQLDRMTNIIEHQLRKASSGGANVWKKKIAFNPVVKQITGVMTKIHADKPIVFDQQFTQDYFFYGDESDLMEILGNLIDNACKACKSQVKIAVTCAQPLTLVVEDDGPGIDKSQRQQLLIRGQRLDTYTQGHGVGMAIVNDLVNSYNATMQIDDSPLGGAKFVVHFANINQSEHL